MIYNSYIYVNKSPGASFRTIKATGIGAGDACTNIASGATDGSITTSDSSKFGLSTNIAGDVSKAGTKVNTFCRRVSDLLV